MRQFGRNYRLELIAQQDVIHIEGLRISFEITKSIDSKPNPARISLWNLNRNTINRLLAGEFKLIKLYVGYSSLRIIYMGDLIRAKVMRDGVDFIIEFECGDGFNDHQSAIFSKTIRAGATIRDTFLNAASTFESPLGSHMLPSNKQLPRAQVFNAPTRKVLNDLANDQNANWFIEDGELNFLPYDQVMNKSIPLLSEQTGLIGSPEQTDQGLEIDCLLNPDLSIGSLILLESIIEYFNGEYKVVHLSHKGDILGDDWLTHLIVMGGKFKRISKNE
ncbi:phage protein [Thorsellia anophelis]|uniref:Phage protein D n=1 Tax=Thorsellia anophelis DSM 18579 TaxID=1123402 RepID=A0A1I0CCZ0_9GAMM|nr:hypothetical protein [Thorsellia anophelis]SET17404.1 hypothetical protein SAMN02583745_01588 [Thorsellia anophelis DSM 18579]